MAHDAPAPRDGVAQALQQRMRRHCGAALPTQDADQVRRGQPLQAVLGQELQAGVGAHRGVSTAVIALVGVSLARGADRGWIYEIIVISIVWTTMVVVGPLVAVVLRRAAAQPAPAVTP